MIPIKVDCDVNVDNVTVFEGSSAFVIQSEATHIEDMKAYGSGIPCVTMLFTLVQHDFGNPEYNNGEGYAERDVTYACTDASIASVDTPGYEPLINHPL